MTMEAEAAWNSIPEDILTFILLRFPVKLLLRFKFVCKTWYDLIKHPNFISMHHNKYVTASHLLIYNPLRFGQPDSHVISFRSNDKSLSSLSPDVEIPSRSHDVVKIVGSCNGIICYCDMCDTFYLFNPATRDFKVLPPMSFQFQSGNHQKFLLSGAAFGFDSPNIHDFKVISLFSVLGKRGIQNSRHRALRAEMNSLSSNTWRQLDWILDDSILLGLGDSRYGLFFANSFHWIVQHHDHETIIYCDIHTEIFKTMNLPPKDNLVSRSSVFSLKVFKEYLSAVVFHHHDRGYHCMMIWIMKDHGVAESWTKLYSTGFSVYDRALCFWMDDHALLLLQEETGRQASCNLNTLRDRLERIEIFQQYNIYSRVIVHKETLVAII